MVEGGDELPTPDVRKRPLTEGASNKRIGDGIEGGGIDRSKALTSESLVSGLLREAVSPQSAFDGNPVQESSAGMVATNSAIRIPPSRRTYSSKRRSSAPGAGGYSSYRRSG